MIKEQKNFPGFLRKKLIQINDGIAQEILIKFMEGNKILVFSIALEGYSSLFRSCIESQRQYCEMFGYTYTLIDKAPKNLLPKEAAWLKIFLLRSALECDYDWVVFIDADCEIRKHAPSFAADFKDYEDGKSIFLAHGFSGRINSGVIFLRKTKEAKDYLEQVINNGNKEVPDEDKALYENGHMIHYGKKNPNVQIIEAEKWNNNRILYPSSYIQHYSGGILREEYLRSRGIKKTDPTMLGKIRKRIKTVFSPGNTSFSMSQMDLLLPFYLKQYPEFHCKQIQ